MMHSISSAVSALRRGLVIAYPTEAVYGLGCDPEQPLAVNTLLTLKKRDPNKGLILISHCFENLLSYIDVSVVPDSNLNQILSAWPGPYTWVFPVKNNIVPALKGHFDSIAVRVTAHTVARTVCEAFGGAIVSTSANTEGMSPAKTSSEVFSYFGDSVGVLEGAVGDLLAPTSIRDALTLRVIR